MARTGRRPGPTTTRDEILEVARAQFAERGYARTTLRSVAEAAGVHPALLHHYFGAKQRLYQDALEAPIDVWAAMDRLLSATPREQVAGVLARHFISTWRHPATGDRLRAQARRAVDDPMAADLARAHLETVVVPRFAEALAVPPENVTAAIASLLGVTMADSVAGIGPLTRLSDDEIVALVEPGLDLLLRPRNRR